MRVLETVLQLDVNFFYRCCTGAYDEDGRRQSRVSSNAALVATFAIYLAGRGGISAYYAKLSQASTDINELAEEMGVAAKNHICTNFESRLVKFIKVYFCYSSEEGKTCVARLNNLKAALTDMERGCLQWLELPPTARNISSHPVLFPGKLYDMLVELESMLDLDIFPKGCTVYTLLPQPTSCIPSFYKVNTSILYQIAERIIRQHSEDIFGLCKTDDGHGHMTFATTAEFQSVRECM